MHTGATRPRSGADGDRHHRRGPAPVHDRHRGPRRHPPGRRPRRRPWPPRHRDPQEQAAPLPPGTRCRSSGPASAPATSGCAASTRAVVPSSRPAAPAHHPDLGARRVLEAASRLFYEHGIHAVGVDLIAAEAGATKRTLYGPYETRPYETRPCEVDARAHSRTRAMSSATSSSTGPRRSESRRRSHVSSSPAAGPAISVSSTCSRASMSWSRVSTRPSV